MQQLHDLNCSVLHSNGEVSPGLGKVDFITRWAVWRIANSRRSKASKGGVPL